MTPRPVAATTTSTVGDETPVTRRAPDWCRTMDWETRDALPSDDPCSTYQDYLRDLADEADRQVIWGPIRDVVPCDDLADDPVRGVHGC